MTLKRGEVWQAKLDPTRGSEQDHDAGGQYIGMEDGIFEAQDCGIDRHKNLLPLSRIPGFRRHGNGTLLFIQSHPLTLLVKKSISSGHSKIQGLIIPLEISSRRANL